MSGIHMNKSSGVKLLFAFVLCFGIVVGVNADVFYTWRYREHATDCTAIVDGKARDLCFEVDSENIYKCEPAAGDCDAPGEWKFVGGPETDTLDAVCDRGLTTDQIITPAGVDIDDGEYFKVGTGDDGQIYSSSDDVYIENVTQDKDIIHRINDGLQVYVGTEVNL